MVSSTSELTGKKHIDMKTCKKCNETKELTEFYKTGGTGSRPQSLRPRCRACTNKENRAYLESRPTKTDYSYRSILKRKYGVTMEWYNAKFKVQQGRCAICSTEEKGPKGRRFFCVDHCHTTGQPRSLLCANCNTGIGMLKDNPILVARAWTYLQQHQQ